MKKLITILTILLLLVGCSEKEVIQEEIEPEEIKTVTTLIMGGDALTHESVYLDNKTNDGYDFTYPFRNIKEIVKNYDLAYYNQETVLGGKEYGVSGYPTFNTPQEVGDSLIDAGFNLVSLATNHLMDYYKAKGNALMLSQIDYFSKFKDVYVAGSYKSKEDRDNIKIYEKNGLTYALLSYTYGSNYGLPNKDEEYLINFIDKDLIKKDVESIRDKVDLLMVAMHWGEENSSEVNEYQKEYAKFLADLDVDIVIGTHPHVLQPVEWIDDTLVIYSLGNLFSNQYFNIDNLSTALISVDIVKTTKGDDTTIYLDNLKADLLFTVLEDKHSVYLYRDLTDNELKDSKTYFDKYTDILQKNTKFEVK